MTLFEAPTYDPRRARRRNIIIAGIVVFILITATLAWVYRNYPEERVVQKFFTALENRDYEKAYGIWQADPNWKQHPQNYPNYSFGDFYQDWGPGGEWGPIHSFHIDGSANPKNGGSGVVVVVTVNDRKEKKARIWVENKTKTLTFSPY
jgi:hypothetical protein